MSTIVKIAGLEFELLDYDEAREATKDCDHNWQPLDKEVIINPAREFVKGYGSQIISVTVSKGHICPKCGLFEPTSEVDKAVRQGKLDTILKMRPPKKNRTICQMLRELRTTVKDTNKIDACLLIAKKMNDTLVRYAGNQYTKTWYDKDGNFIVGKDKQ